MPRIVCIGGLCAGQRIDVNDFKEEFIKVYKPIRTPVGATDEWVTIEFDIYTRRVFRTEHETIYLYVQEKLSDMDAQRELIENYRSDVRG
jgi:hypothetical protein